MNEPVTPLKRANEDTDGEPPSKKQKTIDEEPKPAVESKVAPVKLQAAGGARVCINELYTSGDFNTLVEAHRGRQPFRYSVLPDFLDAGFVASLRESLNGEGWNQQINDLCTLEITADLKQSNQTAVAGVVGALGSKPFIQFVTALTGFKSITLSDMTGNIFKEGSHYLCHNTGMASKRVAFFLFVSADDWEEEDGGAIELFCNSDNAQPLKVAHRIVPKLNTMVILETTANSFYQISEVCSKDKELVLISGFMRSTSIVKSKSFSEPKPQTYGLTRDNAGFKVDEWINPEYLTAQSFKQLRAFYEKNGSLGLNNFLLESKYKELEDALAGADVPWKRIGPPNRRHYDTLGRFGSNEGPNEIVKFKLFLKSKIFINSFLERITGVKVCSYYKGETRRFNHGDYTLTTDGPDIANDALDLHFSFPGAGTWADEDGGSTTYLDGKDELVTIVPSKNTLNLVFREQQCSRYVKYLVASAPNARYDVINTYILAAQDDDEGEDYNFGEEENDSEDEDIVEDSTLPEEQLVRRGGEKEEEEGGEDDWEDEDEESYD